jgi:hypothetical protein
MQILGRREGLLKDRLLTGLKGRSELGGDSIPKAP